MWLYSSQWTMLAASAVTLAALIYLATGRNPFRKLFNAVQFIRRDVTTITGLIGVVGILIVNAMENRIEGKLASLLPWDFTDEVAQFGTQYILLLQKLQWPPLTHLLTFVYVIVFPLLGVASLIVYGARRDRESLRRVVRGFLINYMVALPFYLFVPVKEAWAGTAGIRFLIPEVYPLFEAQYRPLSGLDNCLPSLHTSLALTFALVAWRSGYRALATVLSVAAVAIMFSTLYLGVHWVPDMIAGMLLAGFASGVIPAWVEKVAHGTLPQASRR